MAKESRKLRSEIERNLRIAQEVTSNDYQLYKEDLLFASGDQYTEAEKRGREGRPSMVVNVCRTYINRIVNPFRKHPNGIRVDAENDEFMQLLQKKINDIEYKSRAEAAYIVAHENQVTCGLGWLKVGLDYANDKSLDQDVKIYAIDDPLSVIIDPSSKETDGSDALWGIEFGYIDESSAKANYGEDVGIEPEYGTDMWKNWDKPEGQIPEMVYYKVQEKRVKRYWFRGEVIEDEDQLEVLKESEIELQSRDVVEKNVLCCKYVGQKLVDKTIVNCSYIPLIPVYGEKLFNQNSLNLRGGLIRQGKDSQKMLNFYKSSEAELAASSPRTPFIVAAGQVDPFKKYWSSANTKPHAYLPYKPVDIGGRPVPPPQRADNTAQTQHLIQSAEGAKIDFGLAVGVPDPMLGGEELGDQSGKAILLREKQGELASLQYSDNHNKSIAQVGRVLVELLFNAFDTEREISQRSEDGAIEQPKRLNLKDLVENSGLSVDDIDIKVHAGVSFESRRQEALANIGKLTEGDPESRALILDLLVKEANFPMADQVAKRLQSRLPPHLIESEEGGENAPDPEAMQALQNAQATIDEMQYKMGQYENLIQQYATDKLNEEEQRQADMIEKTMDSETKLAVEEMKQAGENERAMLKAQTDLEKESIKQGSEDERTVAKIAADASKDINKLRSDERKEAQKIVLQSTNQEPKMRSLTKGPLVGKGEQPNGGNNE